MEEKTYDRAPVLSQICALYQIIFSPYWSPAEWYCRMDFTNIKSGLRAELQWSSIAIEEARRKALFCVRLQQKSVESWAATTLKEQVHMEPHTMWAKALCIVMASTASRYRNQVKRGVKQYEQRKMEDTLGSVTRMTDLLGFIQTKAPWTKNWNPTLNNYTNETISMLSTMQ